MLIASPSCSVPTRDNRNLPVIHEREKQNISYDLINTERHYTAVVAAELSGQAVAGRLALHATKLGLHPVRSQGGNNCATG